jgi:hypothetical protein
LAVVIESKLVISVALCEGALIEIGVPDALLDGGHVATMSDLAKYLERFEKVLASLRGMGLVIEHVSGHEQRKAEAALVSNRPEQALRLGGGDEGSLRIAKPFEA